jgi:outer membrane protein, heavy metal efflux system
MYQATAETGLVERGSFISSPTEDNMDLQIRPKIIGVLLFVFTSISSFPGGHAYAQELKLADLVDEALVNNPDILSSQAKIEAAGYRIPQAKSLPDPMVMIGYQNSGLKKYTYGMEPDAQWMFSASQEFPFPGKLALKGAMAESDLGSLKAMHEALKKKTEARIRELYYDLYLAYKNIDLLKNKDGLFAKIEDLALSRYSTGKSMQEEVLMAQTEKYMLLEKEEMFNRKIRSIEAMLTAVLGRKKTVPIGRPADPVYEPFMLDAEEATDIALKNSSEIKSIDKMKEAAGYRIAMAEKEYYPDFTITTEYAKRGSDFMDMWSAKVGLNIPLFTKTKQEPAVREARASVAQIEQEMEAAKLMISSSVNDNIIMIRSAEKLMDLYKKGLIPKNSQGVEAAISSYSTGGGEITTVISLLKTMLDYETLYWEQFMEREKAIARLEALMEVPATKFGGDEK